MDASRRLTTWLRLACALVLSVGLSSAVAATAAEAFHSATTSHAHSRLSVTIAAAESAAVRSATAVHHATARHQPPSTVSALAVAGILLTGLAAFVLRRARRAPAARHQASPHGARAPPAVSCC
jgi:LPXTG-motif cell wall-anchored protein